MRNATHWRAQELKHHSADIVWLDAESARCAYDLVCLYDAKTHLGLNGNTVASVERFERADDVASATRWLRARVKGVQQFVVVLGTDECFLCGSGFLLDNWSNIFIASRDDAMVYSKDTAFILFYCHENQFEVGQRLVFD